MNMTQYRNVYAVAVFCLGLLSMADANALPAFARQTQLPCNGCHNGNFLALNAFGRQFKLNAYTLTTNKTISKAAEAESRGRLSLPELPGVSAMLQTSLTHTAQGIPGQQNNDIQLPQQLSLFLAGRLSDNAGIFSQFTFADGDSGFSMDNTDIRYANTMQGETPITYGFTLDNNPTVGDLWNSTPAWGWPYSGSEVAAGPAAGDFISSIGGAVNGVGSYAMFGNHFYGKVSLYRSSQVAGAADQTNVFDGAVPYWRLAWQTNLGSSYLMIGTYGISADVLPLAEETGNGVGGPTSTYRDAAIDFQYEQPFSGENSIVVHGSYTDETRNDLAADGSFLAGNNGKWKFTKLDAEYNLAGRWRPGIAVFGSNTGSDNLDSSGYILDASYFPWENLQLELQYSGYNKFDGATANASDDNSIYLLLWLVM
jgi:hypothetical protein